MTTISSTTILRSRNAAAPDKVLSTLLLRYPRCIHAEFMTHRVFSRNAASSRAIPVEKLIKDVEENTFFPIHWGVNQRGMQAGEQLDEDDRWAAAVEWQLAAESAVSHARNLANRGLHKQIVNRVLEPFAHIMVLVSSTEWDNFLELRDHPDAEPHIQVLAREIRKCLDRDDDIQELQPGEWHLPFAADEEMTVDYRIKMSVARCASTSYKTVDGFDMTLDKAVALHDRLVGSTPIHASPAEHVAQADEFSHHSSEGFVGWAHSHQHGNFVGFRQYRHMLKVA